MSTAPIDDDQIAEMLHTLAVCEAALSDSIHNDHRERLARVRGLLIGLAAGRVVGSELAPTEESEEDSR